MARKVPADPRLQPQKSALKSTLEASAPQGSPPAASLSPPSSSPTIAPYDPRLLSAGGSVRSVGAGGVGSGSSSSSVLSGISLYDPRTQGSDKAEGSGASRNTSPPPEPKSSESTAASSKPKSKEPLFCAQVCTGPARTREELDGADYGSLQQLQPPSTQTFTFAQCRDCCRGPCLRRSIRNWSRPCWFCRAACRSPQSSCIHTVHHGKAGQQTERHWQPVWRQ